MAGCAVVLAIQQGMTDWKVIPSEYRSVVRIWQLVFGLLYGTALSGLGLLVWRRLRGRSTFPSMPGHWLLVFAGIGFIVDGLTAWLARRILFGNDRGLDPHWLHQTLGWNAAAAVALVCCFVRDMPLRWRIFTVGVGLTFLANAATHSLAVVAQLSPLLLGRPLIMGSWPYYYGPFARVLGETTCLFVLSPLVWMDAATVPRRDWLHWSGVAVIVGLAIADVTQNVLWLVRY